MKANDILKQGHRVTVAIASVSPHLPEELRTMLKDKPDFADIDRTPTVILVKDATIVEGVMAIDGYASTRVVDLDGDILMPDGCDFSMFQKNPVLMVGHNYAQPPIGRVTEITKDAFGVRVKCEFAKTEKAKEYFTLIKDGFLRALSVGAVSAPASILQKASQSTASGFMQKMADLRKQWPELTSECAARCQRIVQNWSMLELSVVNVPNNPYSLLEAIQKGTLVLSQETKDAFDITDVTPGGQPCVIEAVTPDACTVSYIGKALSETDIAKAVENGIEKELARRRGQL